MNGAREEREKVSDRSEGKNKSYMKEDAVEERQLFGSVIGVKSFPVCKRMQMCIIQGDVQAWS